jgi:hypothetical protein
MSKATPGHQQAVEEALQHGGQAEAPGGKQKTMASARRRRST